jgi:excisionase family DNA binding protein
VSVPSDSSKRHTRLIAARPSGLRPLYTIKDVAELLGWNRARTRRFLKNKGVPSCQIGSRVYFRLTDLMTFINDDLFWHLKETGR